MFLCKQDNTSVGMPYEIVMSEVGLISLTDPAFAAMAATPSGSLAYQVREFPQSIISRDRAYWQRSDGHRHAMTWSSPPLPRKPSFDRRTRRSSPSASRQEEKSASRGRENSDVPSQVARHPCQPSLWFRHGKDLRVSDSEQNPRFLKKITHWILRKGSRKRGGRDRFDGA